MGLAQGKSLIWCESSPWGQVWLEMLLLQDLKKAQAEYGSASPERPKEARQRYLDALRMFKDHVMPERS